MRMTLAADTHLEDAKKFGVEFAVFWLIGIVLAAVATLYVGRRDTHSLTRLGYVTVGLGLLGWLLLLASPNIFVLLLGTLLTAYGVVILVGCLALTRCGRRAEL